MAALAAELGIAAPSLYKHIHSLEALRAELALLCIQELKEIMQSAAVGKAKGDALTAIAEAYRAYVREHPGRYAATFRAPKGEELLAKERRDAAAEAAAVVFAVLEGYGIRGPELIDATRLLRSVLHGFTTLEAAGGFGMPREVDRSFATAVQGLDAMFAAWPVSSTP